MAPCKRRGKNAPAWPDNLMLAILSNGERLDSSAAQLAYNHWYQNQPSDFEAALNYVLDELAKTKTDMDRRLIELYFKDDLSFKQVAEITGLSSDVVTYRIYRAIRWLRSARQLKLLNNGLSAFVNNRPSGQPSPNTIPFYRNDWTVRLALHDPAGNNNQNALVRIRFKSPISRTDLREKLREAIQATAQGPKAYTCVNVLKYLTLHDDTCQCDFVREDLLVTDLV